MKTILLFFCTLILCIQNASSQIKFLKEMNTEQIRMLNKEKTIVFMPGGILEEHGPHLPSYTDGFVNDYVANKIAEEITEERNDWTILFFPSIPLGTGGGNNIGLHYSFEGSYPIHFTALRSIYMDLAYELGNGGFKWIFVFQRHGSYWHNLAIDQAAEFFNEHYKGKMLNVTGILIDEISNNELLPAEQNSENGFDVHAGFSETSRILFLRPELVDKNYKAIKSINGENWKDLTEAGKSKNWPGYFGAPKFANAEAGDKILTSFIAGYKKVILDVIDEKDISNLKTIVKTSSIDKDAMFYNNEVKRHDMEILQTQQKWLDRKGY